MQSQTESRSKSPSLRNYRVSTLLSASAKDENKKGTLPMIKIKSHIDGIVIPSVPRVEDYSPRSLDSRSLENGSIISNLSV
jgi:hypothetical protein